MLSENILQDFKNIVGRRNVLSDEIDLLLYSYDASVDKALPSAVVIPEKREQVSEIVEFCYENKIPYVVRGAATNLCGCTVPLQNAIVIPITKLNRILEINPKNKSAVVEPGVQNFFLQKELELYGLTYAPDPASQKACTVGGNIGTNAGGPHCLKYGVTSHHVLGLEVVLPDGKTAEFNLNQPGYDLTGFFVGTEGTLGIVTKATLNLIPIPKWIETMLVSFPSLQSAMQAVTAIIASGIIPSTIEAMDKLTIQCVENSVHAGYPLDAEAVIIIEVDGEKEEKEQIIRIQEICKKNSSKEFRLAKDGADREKLWEGRRGCYPSLARLSPNVLVEDGTVPRTKLPEAAKKVREIAEQYQVNVSLIFHAGDGNLHPQILFDERDNEETKRARTAGHEMLKACVDLGGTISGEHGVGIEKKEAMRWLFTNQTLSLFRKIKENFDPKNLSNPDKLIPPSEEKEFLKLDSKTHISLIEIPEKILTPKNEEETRRILFSLFKNKEKIYIQGTQSRLKNFPVTDHIISTLSLNQMIEHDAENFTVTVQAGMKVEDLKNFLKSKNQKVFISSWGTVGGAIASNVSQNPGIRDQILGMKIILADGAEIDLGTKVMKNVAGYDAAKLLIGSWGTLAVITTVILKTYSLSYPMNVIPIQIEWEEKSLSLQEIHKKIKNIFDPEKTFSVPENLL